MAIRLAKWLVGPIAAGAAIAAGPVLSQAAVAGPALAAYGPTACTPNISVSNTTIAAGSPVTVTISGACTTDTFTVTLHSTPVVLGTMTTNSAGTGTGSFTVPTSTTSGAHFITVADASGNSATASVTVTGGASATSGGSTGPLAFTGTDAAALGAVGAGALGLGGLLVLSSRKRRQQSFR